MKKCKYGHIWDLTCSKYCKECTRVRANKNYQSRRKLINEYKNIPCVDCGNKYEFYIMEFDHRPEHQKEFLISIKGMSVPVHTLIEEINKCDVICSNCHRIRTYERCNEKTL